MTAMPAFPQSTMDMRDSFFTALYAIAEQDPAIVIVSNDFGAPSLDRFRAERPHQFVNGAISEQNILSMAAGMALSGRKPIVYSIASFLTLRALEQVKVDICVMKAKVLLLGVGCGYAYSVDGPTHHATEDIAVMRALTGMTLWSPSEPFAAAALAGWARDLPGPAYLRFDRGRWPSLGEVDLEAGVRSFGDGTDLALVSTGTMVHRALEVAARLNDAGICTRVVDLLRLKPLNASALHAAIGPARRVATMEEQAAPGGLGGLVAEFLADHEMVLPLRRLAIADAHVYAYGERDDLHRRSGLDADGAAAGLAAWVGRSR